MFIRLIKQDPVGDSVPSYNFEPGDTYCGNTDYGNCRRCRLHHTRNRVAVKRTGGTGHVKLLFIGEAPGELENKTGHPFVGIAGKILENLFKLVHFQFQYCITNTVGCRPVDVCFLDSDYDDEWSISPIVKENNEAIKEPEFSLDKYILDEDYELYSWNREPTKAEIELCKPHIDELVENFQPHGVVYLGKVAESYDSPKYLIPIEQLTTPEAKHFTHTKSPHPSHVWRHVPTLSLFHPAYIARMEYKLLTLRKEARKLDNFIERFLNV